MCSTCSLHIYNDIDVDTCDLRIYLISFHLCGGYRVYPITTVVFLFFLLLYVCTGETDNDILFVCISNHDIIIHVYRVLAAQTMGKITREVWKFAFGYAKHQHNDKEKMRKIAGILSPRLYNTLYDSLFDNSAYVRWCGLGLIKVHAEHFPWSPEKMQKFLDRMSELAEHDIDGDVRLRSEHIRPTMEKIMRRRTIRFRKFRSEQQ